MSVEFKILLVDDNEDLAGNLQDILQAQGYSVDIALDGRTALNLHNEARFDLSIIDYKLPDITGLELIREIHEVFEENEYFIIMTGFASLESAIEAVSQADLIGYITKPLDMDQLMLLTRQVYERRQTEIALGESEKKLSESEQKYRTIFESTGTAIALVESDTTIVEVNEEFLKLFGGSKTEIEGKTRWLNFISANECDKFLDAGGNLAVTGNNPASCDVDYITHSGETKHVTVTIAAFPDSDRYLISIMDITERRKTELERMVLNGASRAVLTCTDFTSAARKIFDYCRDVTGAISGYIALLNEEKNENEVLFLESGGMPCSVDPSLPMPVRGMRGEVYRSAKPLYTNDFPKTEWEGLLPGGHVTINNLLFAPLLIEGKVVGIIGLANKPVDFTERDVIIVDALSEICSIALINDRNRGLLQKSEETFRLAMDVTTDGLVDWDIQNNMIYYSPNWAHILGEDEVAFTPDSWSGRLHPNEVEFVKNELRKHLKGETDQYYCQHRMRTRDNVWKWVLDRGRIVSRDENGMALRMIGTMTDISRQKQAEEELVREKTRIENIVNTAQTIILTLDTNGNIVDFNPYTEQLTGYSIEEVKGRNWIETFLPERDQIKIEQLFGNAVLGKRTEGNINPILTRDGEEREIVWYDSVIRDEEGNITGVLSTGQDITERIDAEKAVQESEEKFSRVFYSNPNPMMVVEPVSGLINDVNEAFIEFVGFSYDECLDNTMTGLNLWINEDDRLDFILLLTERESILNFETEMKVKTGDIRSVVLSMETIQISGDPFRIVSVNDITERKKMQEQLIVTDRLASVGELAAGIAHELNNPLTGVIGFSDLLISRDDIPDDIKEDLETINRESIRASQVAKHLLTFARKHPDSKSPVNIERVINNVLDLRSYEQKVNNIEVVRRFETDLPPVMANDFQLQQVFLNIIINAEHFMIEANGHGTLVITGEKKDDVIRVSFRDNGPGIPPDILPLIFNPFYTTKEVGKGTGLGLSICYGIITEHGGSIHAESKPEAGATFIINLPVYEESF